MPHRATLPMTLEDSQSNRYTTPQPGDVVAGYEIKQFLARGGCSYVMDAVHHKTQERVAFKISDIPERNPFIENEIMTYDKVCGIGYVALMEGYGMLDDRAFIATRLQEKGTMADIVHHDIDCDALPQTDEAMDARLRLFQDYTAGTSMAHKVAGVVHGDIKLGNLGVDLQGTGRLFDFGLACAVNSPPSPVFRGTRGINVSPEGYLGVMSPASDVWALGAAAYRAFTLAAPFTTSPEAPLRDHRAETLAGITTTPRTHNPAIPPGVDDAIIAALAPLPEHRPDITELQNAFATAR